MKIRMTDESKHIVAVSEMPAVRKMIEDFKEEDGLKDYVEMAVHALLESVWNIEVLKTSVPASWMSGSLEPSAILVLRTALRRSVPTFPTCGISLGTGSTIPPSFCTCI